VIARTAFSTMLTRVIKLSMLATLTPLISSTATARVVYCNLSPSHSERSPAVMPLAIAGPAAIKLVWTAAMASDDSAY
jgi:hypothetical protein